MLSAKKGERNKKKKEKLLSMRYNGSPLDQKGNHKKKTNLVAKQGRNSSSGVLASLRSTSLFFFYFKIGLAGAGARTRVPG